MFYSVFRSNHVPLLAVCFGLWIWWQDATAQQQQVALQSQILGAQMIVEYYRCVEYCIVHYSTILFHNVFYNILYIVLKGAAEIIRHICTKMKVFWIVLRRGNCVKHRETSRISNILLAESCRILPMPAGRVALQSRHTLARQPLIDQDFATFACSYIQEYTRYFKILQDHTRSIKIIQVSSSFHSLTETI